MVDLREFRGSNTLLLFWRPSCGFCRRMLDDLKAWETSRPHGAPSVLVVSSGTVEENTAMGLRSPVVLDQDFSTGTAFGADGTPMAVIIDAGGRIASDLVSGASAVMGLANSAEHAS
jgi:thiol-disulfide isomerase/thioredoxin